MGVAGTDLTACVVYGVPGNVEQLVVAFSPLKVCEKLLVTVYHCLLFRPESASGNPGYYRGD